MNPCPECDRSFGHHHPKCSHLPYPDGVERGSGVPLWLVVLIVIATGWLAG